MAAVYDEFGNLLYDDPNIPTPMSIPDIDVMKYELAKAGSMPLRPGGSDVPYVASEVPTIRIPKTPPEPKQPYSTATNVPQAIADRLGLSGTAARKKGRRGAPLSWPEGPYHCTCCASAPLA